jgi:hypothetical protein
MGPSRGDTLMSMSIWLFSGMLPETRTNPVFRGRDRKNPDAHAQGRVPLREGSSGMSGGDTFRGLVDDAVLTSRLLPPGWRLVTSDGPGVIAETDVQARS